MKYKTDEKGQTMFEVVMVVGILVMVVLTLVYASSAAIRNSNYSSNKNLSTRYAQAAIEWLRAQRDADYTSFRTRVNTAVWCLNTLSWHNSGSCSEEEVVSGTILHREVSFTVQDVSGKTVILAAVRVYWTDGQGYHEVAPTTEFTDWRQLYLPTDPAATIAPIIPPGNN